MNNHERRPYLRTGILLLVLLGTLIGWYADHRGLTNALRQSREEEAGLSLYISREHTESVERLWELAIENKRLKKELSKLTQARK